MRKKRETREPEADAALPGRNALSSEAYRWLSGNYARIKRTAKGTRIPWQELEKIAGKLGLKDGNGNPPNAETLRKNFYRIGKKREAEIATKKAARNPVVTPGPPPIARLSQAETWRRPSTAPQTVSPRLGAAEEHPLMKRLRERSGG